MKHIKSILTQDNLCTSDPLYVIYQKRQIAVPEGFSDEAVWVHRKDCETEISDVEFQSLQKSQKESPDVLSRGMNFWKNN